MIYNILRVFSGGSHFVYGILALVHPFYIEEFTRFGFADYQVFIAFAQVFAGLGILLGFYKVKFTQVSALLLAILMTGALVTRILIKDDWVHSFPAFLYLCVNSFIFKESLKVKT